jgi:hypothetical protein
MDVIPAEEGPVATAVQHGRTAHWKPTAWPRFGPDDEILGGVDNRCFKRSKSRISETHSLDSRRFPTSRRPGFYGQIVTSSESSRGHRLGRRSLQTDQRSVSQKLATDWGDRMQLSDLAPGGHRPVAGGWS